MMSIDWHLHYSIMHQAWSNLSSEWLHVTTRPMYSMWFIVYIYFTGPPRGLLGPYKMDCVRGLWGHPPGNLRLYMLWSVFWGLLRFFFVHAYSTYIPASRRLRLAVSDRRSTTYGALAGGLRSSIDSGVGFFVHYLRQQHKTQSKRARTRAVFRSECFCSYLKQAVCTPEP